MKNLIAIILSLLLAACGDPAPERVALSAESGTHRTTATIDEPGRINAWFDKQYEEQLMFSPISFTTLRRKELFDQIDDMSVEAIERQLDLMAAAVRQL